MCGDKKFSELSPGFTEKQFSTSLGDVFQKTVCVEVLVFGTCVD